MAEAKRRARQRRVLIVLVVLLAAGLAAGLVVSLRPPSGGSSGGLATANYSQYGVSLRYPSGLTAVPECGSLVDDRVGYVSPIALITSERGVSSFCHSSIPFEWPPTAMLLGRSGLTVAVSQVRFWPRGYRPPWHGRFAAVPTAYPAHLRSGCSAGVRDETRSVAIRSPDRGKVVHVDAWICGPTFATGNTAFRQIVASIRFTK
jgi:hypothetical protein